MQKKQRKEIEQQLSVTIAYFLKKQHPVAAQGMTKLIKSASKEISKSLLRKSVNLRRPKPLPKKKSNRK